MQWVVIYLKPQNPSKPKKSLKTIRTLNTLNTFKTLRTLRNLRTLRTLRTLKPFKTLKCQFILTRSMEHRRKVKWVDSHCLIHTCTEHGARGTGHGAKSTHRWTGARYSVLRSAWKYEFALRLRLNNMQCAHSLHNINIYRIYCGCITFRLRKL